MLLPKKDASRTPADFRPICLQNSPIKGISKLLTRRLQPFIPYLVSNDQTGFVLGRNIADNFVYTADLLNCCYRRNAPTIVLKLDFHKAFDSVNWDSLYKIFLCHGFSTNWCDWMLDILHSGKSSIILNGVLGKWITCRNGLRQGDPLSPYLFIIVADVMPAVSHPLLDNTPCPVLQYADDTLIFLRANSDGILAVKNALHDFELATGLSINFHKTTFLPVGVPSSDADNLTLLFGATVSSFPQTYLGLPLSPHKLSVLDCQPILASCDRYLAGWRASLLNRAGRLTLASAILSALPLHYMAALGLHKMVIKAIDRCRRAFF